MAKLEQEVCEGCGTTENLAPKRCYGLYCQKCLDEEDGICNGCNASITKHESMWYGGYCSSCAESIQRSYM